MLRHFEWINDNARKCLLDRGYSNAVINENLSMPGSKFHRSFASDIKTLVAQFAAIEIKQINSRGKYVESEIYFNQDDFPNGIGTKALLPINEMDKNEAKTIIQKSNRGILLNHAFVNFIPNEWRMTIVWKPQKNYELLITAFPGFPTQSLPKKGMGIVEFEMATKFWGEHCFLEFKK
jgi:hypothetical protein